MPDPPPLWVPCAHVCVRAGVGRFTVADIKGQEKKMTSILEDAGFATAVTKRIRKPGRFF